ncbi:restriction endonuclease subunit S [Bacillus cereus]|uniref:restriction endonuclease subunit S n=1 Tax=Bacillus cereus TaxID=1396 RepID=UPI0035CC9296
MRKFEQSQKMKNSGERWLGYIPREWKTTKIKWLTSVKRGASPRPIDDPKYFDENGKYAWVRIADVSKAKMYLEITTQKMSDLGSSLSVKREPGDIFLSIAGTVGKPCITNIKCCIHDGFVYFPNYKGDARFLYYIFESGEPYKGLGKMGTQLNLNTDTVGSVVIPNIDLELQRVISDYLDYKTQEIDSLITDKEQLISLLKEKRQSMITKAVTKGLNPNVKMKDSGVEWIGEIPEHWEVKKFKRCFKVVNGKEINVELDVEDQNGIDVFGSGGKFKKTNESLYSGESVLFGRKGTIGKPLYVSGEFWVVDTMYFTKFYQDYYPKWFYYVLKIYPWHLIMTQTALPSIVGSDIENDRWCIPTYKEQKEISFYLDAVSENIDNLISDINNQIKNLKDYRQSLIYEAVTGKIDVRDFEVKA